MLKPVLINAYRWHRLHPSRVIGSHGLTFPVGFMASDALRLARRDVAGGIGRYPNPAPAISWQPENKRGERLACVGNPEAIGLRFVGEVVGDCGGRNGVWNTGDKSGWYTQPCNVVSRDDFGLAWGEVYQLPGHKGKCRFVAGFRFGGCESGPTIDFATIYSEPACVLAPSYGDKGKLYPCWEDNPRDTDAAKTAARAADFMASRAAEEERDYQAAWQAGARYADIDRDIRCERTAILALLSERRTARAAGLAGYPVVCETIRNAVASGLNEIRSYREEKSKLMNGDYVNELTPGFYTGEERLKAAFNDGAGETIL